MAALYPDPLRCVDLESGDKATVKSAGGHLEAHPIRALACSLLVVALGLGSTNGCSGGSGALPTDAGEQPINYTFDHGTEGWALATSLGADGGSPPTLGFAGTTAIPTRVRSS
jgi:hypothetical protein